MAVEASGTWGLSSFPGVTLWVLIHSSHVKQHYQVEVDTKIGMVL